MVELIITSILAVLIFTVGKILNLSNAALDFLFNFIPVLIPTLVMWKNSPKNYLKFISLKRNDINFKYSAKLKECTLLKEDFFKIQSTFLKLNNKSEGDNQQVFNTNTDENIYSTVFQINSITIELIYYLESQNLFLTINDRIMYKTFFKIIRQINNSLSKVLSEIKYKNMETYLKINFLQNKQAESNPFVKKIFKSFNKNIISITYLGKYCSKIYISNNSIEFMNDNIDNIESDLKRELLMY